MTDPLSPSVTDGDDTDTTGAGAAVAVADHGPSPAVFTARTCTRYATPLDSDDTV